MPRSLSEEYYFRNWIRQAIILIFLIIVASGCAPRMPPFLTQEHRERILSNVVSIGVLATPDIPEAKLMIPAKGRLDGGKKGALSGTEIGLKTCTGLIDLEELAACLLLTPVFSGVGSISGAIRADPASVVTAREIAVREAVAEMDVQKKMDDVFWKIKDRAARFKFQQIAYTEPLQIPRLRDYHYLKNSGIDLVQEMTVTEFGLRGEGLVQPDLSAYMVLRVRLIRTKDNYEFLIHDFTCTSKRNKFALWADSGSQLLRSELNMCYDHLAKDVVTKIYLSHSDVW